MQVIEILKEAATRVYQNVKDIAGTKEAAGDYGRGAGGDISRRIDIIAEKTVLDYFKEIKFDCVVLGEECGRVELSSNPKGFVIMDAIDGSANAVRGLPFFSCSLAFATENRLSSITDGVIADLSSGDLYWASKGKGSFCNDNKIHVRQTDAAYRIIGVNLSGASSEQINLVGSIFEAHNHTRHFGSNALEMALMARGLMDAFVDLRQKIRVLDLAAGYILIKEAGGIIVDNNVEPLESDLEYKTRLSYIAAKDKKILDYVLSIMKKQ